MKLDVYISVFFLFISALLFQNCKKTENLESESTIDREMQKTAVQVLEHQLKNFDAKYGSVLIMEVATGKARALVNLTKTEGQNYKDSINYILNDYSNPGSIFMPVSLLAALDDGYIDDKATIQSSGNWYYEGSKISDGIPGGNYSLSDILAKSSNVSIAKIIIKNYESNPQAFYNKLKEWKFLEKWNDGKQDKSFPKITTPSDKNWSKPTLASASFGYSIDISPLQITNFYNAVANKGKLMKPIFNESQKTEIVIAKIASEKSLQTLSNALTESAENGTLKSNFTKNFKVAGKAGTTRLEYWKTGPAKYQASFVGYFPAENPKYTCYVSIGEPNTAKGFYGATVAAPVFKEIAAIIWEKK